MTANRFYISPSKIKDDFCFLEEEEHFHFSKVLRGKKGDRIYLTDGKGNLYQGEVVSVESKETKVKLLDKRTEEKDYPEFVVAQSLLRSETMDLVIQKATELGADIIFPIYSKRSKYLKKETLAHKLKHWESIAINAIKQSKRLFLPKIEAPIWLEEFIEIQKRGIKIIFSENCSFSIKSILSEKPESATLLFGPEGGWQEEEEILIKERGFVPVSLGKNILRSETAVISALSILNVFWRY